jgi:glucose uptake protein GlcU
VFLRILYIYICLYKLPVYSVGRYVFVFEIWKKISQLIIGDSILVFAVPVFFFSSVDEHVS